MNKTQEIALIGILSAINIASRLALQMLPNIKPVTSIIIISVIYFGLIFGLKLTFVTTIVSDIFLGIGTWTIFQILAWASVCVLTELLVEFFKGIKKEPPLLLMAIFAALMGYVFGFVVSLEQYMLGGLGLFIAYYLNGIFFDTLHAIGNFFFYLICFPLLSTVIKRKFKNSTH